MAIWAIDLDGLVWQLRYLSSAGWLRGQPFAPQQIHAFASKWHLQLRLLPQAR